MNATASLTHSLGDEGWKKKERDNVILTQLHTQIHELSRQEKYRLIQFIVHDLAQEEPPRTDEHFARPVLRQYEQQDTSKAQAIDTFLRKWKGFLKGVEPENAKRHYLQEKYR